MTPEERQMVDDLFGRLADLENTPRDADAERLIADGARRAPHALYALVQTALVQDEALKQANARIEELQAQLSDDEQPPPQQGGFLDSMRDAVFGRREGHGSVPAVRQRGPGSAFSGAPGYPPEPAYPPPAPMPGALPPQAGYPVRPGVGPGGSFLGTAASAAAGMIGGALLLDGIRSMFGHGQSFGGVGPSAFGGLGGGGAPAGGSAAGGALARDAGLNQIRGGGGNAGIGAGGSGGGNAGIGAGGSGGGDGGSGVGGSGGNAGSGTGFLDASDDGDAGKGGDGAGLFDASDDGDAGDDGDFDGDDSGGWGGGDSEVV